MKTAHDIIVKPIITEESMTGLMMKNIPLRLLKTQTKSKSPKPLKRFSPALKLLR